MSEYEKQKAVIKRMVPEIYEESVFNADMIEEYMEEADKEITRLNKLLTNSEAGKFIETQRNEITRLIEASDKIASKLEWWTNDGSRPDEWLLQEWARTLREALQESDHD